ncbi:hypothetical protein PInf_003220 [Phytophthora infestans]|nr:hypothetical protein PInf_003220 [Phytophthora infestans]
MAESRSRNFTDEEDLALLRQALGDHPFLQPRDSILAGWDNLAATLVADDSFPRENLSGKTASVRFDKLIKALVQVENAHLFWELLTQVLCSQHICAMSDVTVAILAVVVAASMSTAIATADKRGLRRPSKAPRTFNTRAFETALRTPGTGWIHDKLRCDKKSFLRIYRLVHAAWDREPGPNTKGGTMDQAATALGISRPRSVVYINDTLDVLSAMAKSIISMPPAEELAAVEDGFYATAGFPDTIGTVDGTLIRITRHTTLKAGSVARISLQ